MSERLMVGSAMGRVATGKAWWTQTAILALVIGVLYFDILRRLVLQWWDDPNFSHGFFVPLFAAYVLWLQRRQLGQLEARPSWFGLGLMALGLTILIVGVLGAELFLSRVSLLLLLAGLVIQLLGWNWMRALAFPWAFLALMIPIPALLFNQIAFPLQLLAARMATALLSLLGVPVFREGNVIQLASMSLEVVEACSGIRSLVSLVTLAVIYGYLLETSLLRRTLLAVAAIPIAVIANALRVMGTGLLGQYWDPEKAQGFFHEFSGWVIFVLSLAMLFLFHNLLQRIGPKRGERPA
jgi:exosortase